MPTHNSMALLRAEFQCQACPPTAGIGFAEPGRSPRPQLHGGANADEPAGEAERPRGPPPPTSSPGMYGMKGKEGVGMMYGKSGVGAAIHGAPWVSRVSRRAARSGPWSLLTPGSMGGPGMMGMGKGMQKGGIPNVHAVMHGGMQAAPAAAVPRHRDRRRRPRRPGRRRRPPRADAREQMEIIPLGGGREVAQLLRIKLREVRHVRLRGTRA